MNRPSIAQARTNRLTLQRLSLPVALISVGLILLVCGFRVSDLSARLQSAGRWAPILFVTVGVLSMSMLMPKTMVSLAAGALFGTPVGCPVMLVTAVAAAALNYSIGKYWIASDADFRPIPSAGATQMNRVASSAPTPVTWPVAIRQLARNAGFGIHLLVRLSPIPTTLISYSMGAARAKFIPYVGAAAVAVIPQFLYVHAASLVTAPDQSLRYRWISSVLSLSVAVIVSISLPQIAMRRLREIRG